MLPSTYKLFDFAEGQSLYISDDFSKINGWSVDLHSVIKVQTKLTMDCMHSYYVATCHLLIKVATFLINIAIIDLIIFVRDYLICDSSGWCATCIAKSYV